VALTGNQTLSWQRKLFLEFKAWVRLRRPVRIVALGDIIRNVVSFDRNGHG